MRQLTFKRFLPFAVAALMIFSLGCGNTSTQEKATDTDAVVIVTGGDTESQSVSTGTNHSSLYSVDGTTETSNGESYASDTEDVNAVLVKSLGILTMTSADINKTGDVTGDYTDGNNAAVAVISKGQLTLNQSNITTNGTGAVGLIVSGEGTQLAVNDTSCYTSGESSPVLIVREDASAMITSGSLSTEGADSACILLLGGRLTLSGVTLSSKSGDTLRVLSGDNFLTLDQTTISAMPILADGTTLVLKLQNGASFTGELGGTLPAKASVTLDAMSKLTLTAETYLTGFVNADTTHQNIESNGFNLYYDSNAPENAYLNAQSFLLPGGGFLAPII